MKLVEWTDKKGYKHLSAIRDNDPDEMAPSGISLDPPNINQLDWNEIKKDLHNLLVELRLSTWRDVQSSNASVTSAILGSLRRRLLALYRSQRSIE